MSSSVGHVHRTDRTARRGSILEGVRVRLHRGSLDRALATGEHPSSSRDLTRRAEQLTSLRYRRTLAAGLIRTVKAAETAPRPLTSAIPVPSRAILAAREEIEQLADDIGAPGDVQPRGVLLVRNLLTDGSSPLFAPRSDAELKDAVRHAHAALLLR